MYVCICVYIYIYICMYMLQGEIIYEKTIFQLVSTKAIFKEIFVFLCLQLFDI